MPTSTATVPTTRRGGLLRCQGGHHRRRDVPGSLLPLLLLLSAATTWRQGSCAALESGGGDKIAVVASALGDVSVVDHASRVASDEHSHMAAPSSRHKGQWMRRDKDNLMLPDLGDGSGGELPALVAQDVRDADGHLEDGRLGYGEDADALLEGGSGHPYKHFQVKDSCSSKGLAIVDSEAECEQAATALGFPKDGRTVKVRYESAGRPAGCYLYTAGGRIHKLEFNRKLTSGWTSASWRDMFNICKKATMVKWSQHPTKCMAVVDNSVLGIFECNENDPNQQFVVPPLGTGPIKWVKQLGKCVGLSGGRTALGTHFSLAPCNGQEAQKFHFPSPGTKGLIKQMSSDKCVDVSAGRNVNNNKLHLWACNKQNVNQVFSNPPALPAVPFPISCHTTGVNLEQQQLMVICPGGCKTANDWTWGSGKYRINSAICRAGIHAGVITDEGGTLLYERKDGKSHYPGSKAHGVVGRPGGGSKHCFSVSAGAGGAAASGEAEAAGEEEEPEEPEEEEETEETEPPTTSRASRAVRVAAPVPAPATTEEPQEEATEAPATTTAAPAKKSSGMMVAGGVVGLLLLGGIGAGAYFGRRRMLARAAKEATFDDVAAEAEGEWGEDEWHEDEWGAEGAGAGGEGEHHEEPESGY